MKQVIVLVSLVLGSSAFAGSVYDHANGAEFLGAAKDAYLTKAKENDQRTKIIETAQDECGGRYEGVETNVIELSHEIEVDKGPIQGSDADYMITFTTTTTSQYMVLETIKCSVHGGHYASTLHAHLMSGTEEMGVTYHYVNDQQQGEEKISSLSRKFKFGQSILSNTYKTPYGTVIKP